MQRAVVPDLPHPDTAGTVIGAVAGLYVAALATPVLLVNVAVVGTAAALVFGALALLFMSLDILGVNMSRQPTPGRFCGEERIRSTDMKADRSVGDIVMVSCSSETSDLDW